MKYIPVPVQPWLTVCFERVLGGFGAGDLGGEGGGERLGCTAKLMSLATMGATHASSMP
jgi:hypothetical protein